MRLSFNEIRARGAQFAESWADATYEKGETQSFYNDFFGVFGVERRSVARYEEHVKKLDNRSGFIDLFWPKVLLVEQKSAGRDLTRAGTQAGEYFDALKPADRPRFQLLCDFQTFQLLDRDTREETTFALADLPAHVEKFGFIMGMEKRSFKDQDPVNIEAAELVGHLHDALEASGYTGHRLEVFLTRIVFCLFADDTGIFEPRDIFLEFIEARTKEDGSDLGALLNQLFEVLDTPEDQRQSNLDEDLAHFPYVNGSLFADPIRTPAFDSGMRTRLIEAARFNWSGISPAIFGSLFQSVMNREERRKAGAHYTTEKNIMKVIGPLFLDGLRAEFDAILARKTQRKKLLEAFQDKLAGLTFFDPACGCGNFLIITYRELRLLEIEVLRALHPAGQLSLDAQVLSKIDVDQFYGIEFSEFPARIAETAMWMMDHIMNAQLSLVFGQVFLRIPLRKSPSIAHADALELDWTDLLPPERCSYIIGNPPFSGFVLRDAAKTAQLKALSRLGLTGGRLDYVAYWFAKVAAYIKGQTTRAALVSTNSIVQGEQIGQLWPVLFDRYKIELDFAHRTFAWGSEARGKAQVHVIIVGFSHRANAMPVKRLFSYETPMGTPTEVTATALSPYLIDASSLADPNLVVSRTRTPVDGLPVMRVGSKPVDGGHYILNDEERAAFLAAEPNAAPFIRPFVGGREFLNGQSRWIIYPESIPLADFKGLTMVRERISRVRNYREKSPGALGRSLADTPQAFHVTVVPSEPFLAFAEVSSERREYAPVGWMEPPTIPSNKILVVHDAEPWLFALLQSAMHMSWMRQIGGRMKSDYSYSPGLVYNTFPLPDADLMPLAPHAQAILDARAAHPDASLAELYDPNLMPAALRRAHQANDRAVEKLYRRRSFASERERVEHLFQLYEKMTAGMLKTSKPKRPRRRP